MTDVPRETIATLPYITVPVGSSLDYAERLLLEATLNATGWSKIHAAQVLGRSTKTIYTLIDKYRLKPPPRPAILPRSAA